MIVWRMLAVGLLGTAYALAVTDCSDGTNTIELQPFEIVCNGVTSTSTSTR